MSLEHLMSLTTDAFMNLLDQKMRSLIHTVPIDRAPKPETKHAEDADAFGVSDLVEKTFKTAPVMRTLDGEAWLLDHGFRSEESISLYTAIIYRWIWSGRIEDKERRIRVVNTVTSNEGDTWSATLVEDYSWSATLVEDYSCADKLCCGDSPMSALDALLHKYILTSEGKQS